MKIKKVISFLILIIFIFLFFEFGARVIIKFYPVYPNCNAVWRLMWKKTYQNRNQIDTILDEYNPTRGWGAKPYLNKAMGYVTTNSRGLRGQGEYAYKKPNDKIRILILGDSMTFGFEVDDVAAYPYKLEKMLPNSQIINFGVCGYGHDQMLIYLKEEGIKYNPDIVIIGFIAGDMERNILSFRSYAKPKFRLLAGKLILVNCPVLTPEKTFNQEKYRLRILDLAEIISAGFRNKMGIKDRDQRAITEAIFDEIISVVESIHAIPIFAYLPSSKELVNIDIEMNVDERFLSDYCTRKGVHYMSTRPYFAAFVKKGAMLKTYGHWDEFEHSVAAQAIRDYLRKIIK